MNVGHSASRPHRRVRLKGYFVAGLHFFHCGRQRGSSIAFLERFFCRLGSDRTHVLIQIFLLGEGPFGRTPANPQGFGGANGGPFVFRDDAEEIALGHSLQVTGNFPGYGVVHTHQLGAHPGRTNHAAVQHSGHAHIRDVWPLAENFGREIDARDGLADDCVGRRIFGFAEAFHIQREAFAGNLQRIIEIAGSRELSIRDFSGGIGLHAHDAFANLELAGRGA